MHLALVNFLWILFTVIGLGIFGWAPATTAAFGVIRKILISPDSDVPLFRTFLSIYKKDFIRANALGIIILSGGILLFLSSGIINEMNNAFFIRILLIGVAFVFGVIVMFSFPVFSHYRLTIRETFRHSFLIGLANLHYFIVFVVILAVLAVIYGTFPGFIIFYLVSIPIIIIMHFCLRIFDKIEKQTVKTE